MKIVQDYPPNYDTLLKHFDIAGRPAVFTWGDILYNPKGGQVDKHLLAHEQTHAVQQGADPQAWWDRYIADPEFRVQQEVEAYGAQYRFVCAMVSNDKVRKDFLFQIASGLSGPVYGSMLTHAQAESRIRHASK